MTPPERVRFVQRHQPDRRIAQEVRNPRRGRSRDHHGRIDLAGFQRCGCSLSRQWRGGKSVSLNAGLREDQRGQHAHARSFGADGDAQAPKVLQLLHRRRAAMKDPERLIEQCAKGVDALLPQLLGKARLHDGDVGLSRLHPGKIVDGSGGLQHLDLDILRAQRPCVGFGSARINAAGGAARDHHPLWRRRRHEHEGDNDTQHDYGDGRRVKAEKFFHRWCPRLVAVEQAH